MVLKGGECSVQAEIRGRKPAINRVVHDEGEHVQSSPVNEVKETAERGQNVNEVAIL